MNPSLLRDARHAAEFDELLARCAERGIAVQTIKRVASRRWPEGTQPTHATWYEPLHEPAEIERAANGALARPGVFVDTAGDLRLLGPMLRAGASFAAAGGAGHGPSDAEPGWAQRTEPLFVRGFAPSA